MFPGFLLYSLWSGASLCCYASRLPTRGSSLLSVVLYCIIMHMHNKRDWRLDTERERKEKEKSERKKDAKAKARKNKVPKLNDKIPPNFDFIPISRVFSVKPNQTIGDRDRGI